MAMLQWPGPVELLIMAFTFRLGPKFPTEVCLKSRQGVALLVH
eukprot:CAMPEP_0197721388 /NCGR_PEP_ID=MMETSP1434-20131217/4448_1 /TAXON_ID=265543 /ORGANISM="Minutocellus polymorphus, Strain CCMP3303" /LENGTH=42 /DNA_ID= /DNA_START= /DNA_END= /DNA_ORIENTATION=